MKFIIGLGNIGLNYTYHRHNIGFMANQHIIQTFNAEKYKKKHLSIIFKTQLNKFSKINEVNELKFVFVRPFKQTDKILDKEKRSKIKNILLRLDNDIDNDILNALLLDIKSEKKSSVNQNFLNSF